MTALHYELVGDGNLDNTIKTVLNNRGIKDWEKYINLSKASRTTYQNLHNTEDALKLFLYHYDNNHVIGILEDVDVDGVTSCTLMYKYIKSLCESYPVYVIVHKKNKAHGLEAWDFDLPERIKLLIVPDAGSNDIQEHIKLKEMGIDCICLDHHQITADVSASPAIIVNNQDGDYYSNKDCSGVSIALEFCRALDDELWEDYADNFLDLAALGNTADVMDMSNFETRALVNEGFRHINNKMFQAIIDAQEFSMKGEVTPHTVSFYVAPLINSFLRMASYEERILLAKAFCEDESETYSYTKRGQDFPVEEDIYQYVIRLMKSYKTKQDRIKTKAVDTIMDKIDIDDNNKVLIFDVTDIMDGPLAGLAAIKVSEQIHKPTLLVRRVGDNLAGSGRSFNNCPIQNFRQLVEDCPYTTLAAGHPSAFGTELPTKDLELAQEWFNEKLSNVSMDKIYMVDFILDAEDISIGFIQNINSVKWLWCHGVEEPVIAIENIHLTRNEITVQGKNQDSIAFEINGIKFVQFKLKEGDIFYEFINDWEQESDDEINVNVVGTCSINVFQGIATPQFIINDCETI